MRGDAGITAGLLIRPSGLAGLAMAAGGGMVIGSAFAPWRTTVATVTLLGLDDERIIEAQRGLPAMPSGWIVAALGVVIVGSGLAVALDRPPPRVRSIAAVAAILAAVVAVATVMLAPGGPPPETGELLSSLGAEGGQLPSDVEVAGEVRRGYGPWLAVAGAVVTLAGAACARDA